MSKRKSSLGFRFVILVAVVLSITMSTSAYYSVSLEAEKHKQSFLEKGDLLADVVSLVSPEAIYAFDFFTLNENVKEVSMKKNVIYCAIKDQNGEYITSFLNLNNPFIKRNVLKSNSKELNVVLPLVSAEKNVIVITKAIKYDDEILGEIYLGMSTQEIEEDYNKAVERQLLLSFLVILLLSVTIYYIFKKSALNRIRELINCSEAVAKGDLDQAVIIHNNDELSQLGLVFNEMISTLKNNIGLKELVLNQIKELNSTLENKVKARTEELKYKNNELSEQQDELKHHRDNLQELVHEQTADILKEKEKVEIASAAKTEFLANMSHELRTPLHAILSFSKFGLKKVDTATKEKTKEYFEKIGQSGSRLLDLVNDLLDLAKLESGKLVLNFQDNDLINVYKQIEGEFEILCKEKSVSIELVCDDASIMAEFDQQKIEQVFRNLMSNAVKFTEENTVITVAIDDLGEKYKLSVTDQGIGIPNNEMTAIFDKFIQSSKTKNGSGGTGLGLPISKQIIELHNGEIMAENSTDGGARLWFSLPKKHVDGK